MTKRQAKKAIAKLEAENHGAIARVFACTMPEFWVLYVAKSPEDTFPAWPDTEADDEENREKRRRLHEAWDTASKRHMEIYCELRKLYRIVEE